ncbi:MAG: putative Ig domain-containing protein [Bacteroidales bacterium]|nr:putative Ig domain-containing protein [Bacteroidales bacterium]
MKKLHRYIVCLIILSGLIPLISSYGQMVVFPVSNKPDTTAYVGQVYQFKDSAITDFARYPITYTLVKDRPGMTINQTTGLITWTPVDFNSGGKVIVKATNNTGDTARHEYFIYVSDGYPCPDSLKAYWKLDETSGTTYYDWIGSNDAIAALNAPTDSSGMVDKAQYFNPENKEGMTVPANDVINWETDESFSVEFWFKNSVSAFDSTAVIMGRNEGGSSDDVHWWFGFFNDDVLNFIIRKESGSIAQCTFQIGDTDWHHIVGVRDAAGNKIKLYVDKIFADEDVYDGNGPGLTSLSAPLTIGFLTPDPGFGSRYPYNGKIDDIKIYNKVVTSTEITASYNKGINNKAACYSGNFAPLFISEPVTEVNEKSAYSYKIAARDIDAGDIITYTIENKPTWLNYNISTKTFSATPTNAHVGSYLIVIKISDGKNDVYQSFTLTVKNLNDPPVITSTPTLVLTEDDTYSYQVTATDIDAGDHKVFSATIKPSWLSMNASTGLLSGTPPMNDTSSYNVTIRVTDDSAAYDEQSFVIDIQNINDPPVISGLKAININEDESHTISLNDFYWDDPDHNEDELTLVVKNGTKYSRVGATIYPEENYHGTLRVPIELKDPEYTAIDTLVITVISVNDVPEFKSVAIIEAYEDVKYEYQVNVDDNDTTDVLVLSGVTVPSWLQLNTVTKILSGTPTNDQVGYKPDSTYAVRLRVSDGKTEAFQDLNITVHNVNDAPVITGQNDTLVSYPDSVIALNLSYVDVTDVDNPPEDMDIIIHNGTGYTVSGKTITLNNNATGKIYVNIRATDGQLSSEVYNLAIKIGSISGYHERLTDETIVHSVYPNPASDFISFELNKEFPVQIEILDLNGNIVLSKPSEDNGTKVDISHLSDGVYFYRLLISNRYVTGKFMVVR